MATKEKEPVKSTLHLFEAHARVSTLKVIPRVEGKGGGGPVPSPESRRPPGKKGER